MKKILAIFMTVIIAFSLCACGKKDSDTSALVGRWVTDDFDSYFTYMIIDFYDDGVFLKHSSDKQDTMEDDGGSHYGSWEVRDGYVIMYNNGESNYSALYIKSDTELIGDNGHVYEKVK